jgi:hypothetical protein
MTLASFSAALAVTAALGISFRTTRGIGIAAIAALCFIYPVLAIVILVGVSALAYYFLMRR